MPGTDTPRHTPHGEHGEPHGRMRRAALCYSNSSADEVLLRLKVQNAPLE
jgi:hypothetical protein